MGDGIMAGSVVDRAGIVLYLCTTAGGREFTAQRGLRALLRLLYHIWDSEYLEHLLSNIDWLLGGLAYTRALHWTDCGPRRVTSETDWL